MHVRTNASVGYLRKFHKQLEGRHLLTRSSSLDPIFFALPSPTACQPFCPANSLSRPLTTSGYGEISGPRMLCLVSRQNRQRNRLLWRATHIVLQELLIIELSGQSYLSQIPHLNKGQVISP